MLILQLDSLKVCISRIREKCKYSETCLFEKAIASVTFRETWMFEYLFEGIYWTFLPYFMCYVIPFGRFPGFSDAPWVLLDDISWILNLYNWDVLSFRLAYCRTTIHTKCNITFETKCAFLFSSLTRYLIVVNWHVWHSETPQNLVGRGHPIPITVQNYFQHAFNSVEQLCW